MTHGDLVTSCFKNVVATAGRFCGSRPGLDIGDAVSAGTMALVDGARRYRPLNPDAGAAGLWHFIKARVKGSMADAERTRWATNRVDGRGPRFRPIGRRQFATSSEPPDPFIVESLGILTPKERELIRMIYWEGESAAAAGVRLGYSVYRGPQIHREALAKLREWLA
jgi:DNA-directed RNA polymerase specialized sigma subunit